MYRKTYVEINLDNLNNNIKNIMDKYPDYKYYIAMVKANAYGHGMYVINQMIESGINYFAISSLEEAMKIREYNKDIPILCTEVIELDSINIAIKNNITLTIHDIDYLNEIIKSTKEKIKIHIKIDTGMNRLGIKYKKDFNELINIIKLNKNIYLEGLYTHFATPGVNDKFFDIQIDNFRKITSDIDLKDIPIIHMSSSFILLSHPKIEFTNAVRIGTILYGYDISQKTLSNSPKNLLIKARNNYLIKKNNVSETYKDIDIDLKKCFSLKTNIIQIKDINPGEAVGYGLLFKSTNKTRVATLPIGYDDGIGTNHIGRRVIINNKKFRVVGEISMCMMNVEVDDTINVGDTVTIIGEDITLGQIARINGTSFHNTMINIGKTLPRIYTKNNKIVYESKEN